MNVLAPQIKRINEKLLIGQHLSMSVVQNDTGQLWSQFAPRIKEIRNRVGKDKFSLQVYPLDYFQAFHPSAKFEKWAAVEVESHENIPTGMECFTIPSGRYAVFHYKGSSADNSIFQYIYTDWLPNSDYQLDHRPHFEVLGDKYRNNDSLSEEEIWIPIALKS